MPVINLQFANRNANTADRNRKIIVFAKKRKGSFGDFQGSVGGKGKLALSGDGTQFIIADIDRDNGT